jgi:hypothetical protein
MNWNRRTFLQRTAAAGGALALPWAGLFAPRARASGSTPLGPLVRDPAGILDLPAGFSYRILQRRHQPMSDGYRVPGCPDGMGCFDLGHGKLALMRNHEVPAGQYEDGPCRPGQRRPDETYDRTSCWGGVSRVVLDARTLEVESSNLVLFGTVMNCAGGTSPWGWLSCEETVQDGHGFVFLCDATADRVRRPRRIDCYGRFQHEAVAIDPDTHIAYLTEDRPDGCLYRFVPADRARPFRGRLQALTITGEAACDTGSTMRPGDTFDAHWIDVADPTPADDSLRHRCRERGAALLSRGEGICWAGGTVYISATAGGPVGGGQIFALEPSRAEGGDRATLTLLAQSEDLRTLQNPDNITLAPWGDLYIAEDGIAEDSNDHLRVLTRDGRVLDLARNALSGNEFAGVCFAPDGRTLFCNLQKDGLTMAISGPFRPF